MASRRLAASTVNWAAFAERVPPSQKASFLALKGKTDGYLRKVNAFPAEPPKLDFAAYKGKVAVPGLVESFQKAYEAVKVPYPADNYSAQIDAQEKKQAEEVKRFIEESNQRIKEHDMTIAKWDTVMPYEEMTMEDFYDAHPTIALDTTERPTVWPHDAESQNYEIDNVAILPSKTDKDVPVVKFGGDH